MLGVDFWEGIKQGAKGEAWQDGRGTATCRGLFYRNQQLSGPILVKCNTAGLNYGNHHLSGPPVYPAGAMQWCEDLT